MRDRHVPTAHRPAPCARAATLLVLSWLGASLIGCSLPKPPPEAAPASTIYTGPAATMAQRVGRHTGVFECPTPGWRVTLDQVRDAPEGWTHAFVSLRSPSPVFVYSQVITHQEVSLGIDVSRPTRLYARALDHDGRGPGAYVRAAESTNPVPTPAPK